MTDPSKQYCLPLGSSRTVMKAILPDNNFSSSPCNRKAGGTTGNLKPFLGHIVGNFFFFGNTIKTSIT